MDHSFGVVPKAPLQNLRSPRLSSTYSLKFIVVCTLNLCL